MLFTIFFIPLLLFYYHVIFVEPLSFSAKKCAGVLVTVVTANQVSLAKTNRRCCEYICTR